MVERQQMILPALVEQLQQQALLRHAHDFRAEIRRLLSHLAVGGLHDALTDRVVVDALFRSEEHTSELQSLMRISYAVFRLKTTNHKTNILYLSMYFNHS